METATLTFRRGDEVAHVVHDGKNVRIYYADGCKSADKLIAAIAQLEGQGFEIVTDIFN